MQRKAKPKAPKARKDTTSAKPKGAAGRAERKRGDDGDEDLDEILSSLGVGPAAGSSAQQQQQQPGEWALLSTDAKLLDMAQEVRRRFGAGSLADVEGRRDRRSRGGALGRLKSKRKSVLGRPDDDWGPADGGVRMFPDGEVEAGTRHFAFRLSEEHERLQREFLSVVHTYDPQNIAYFLRRHPFHVDALLQVGAACAWMRT